MKAIVYKQCTPTVIRSLRVGDETHEECAANLVPLDMVEGTKRECWEAAKKLTRLPVLEFDVPFLEGK